MGGARLRGVDTSSGGRAISGARMARVAVGFGGWSCGASEVSASHMGQKMFSLGGGRTKLMNPRVISYNILNTVTHIFTCILKTHNAQHTTPALEPPRLIPPTSTRTYVDDSLHRISAPKVAWALFDASSTGSRDGLSSVDGIMILARRIDDT